MTRKVFQLSIELDLHAITCPGVWLCPNNGKVSLCIYMFDTWRETSLIYPVFPLLIHEKFKFTKDISNAKSLSDIQNALNSEHLYCELVQWSELHRSKGIILSNFKTCLSNLLYPTDGNKQLITGVDTELLMNPCPPFPGIIAPKIEIATRTTIKETMSKCTKKCPTYILNPKVIRSAHCGRSEKFRRQRGVCHSDRSGQNENRLRPSSLSKLDSYRTKRQLDLYDTNYEQNKQRNVNSIDDNNNNYCSTTPCECCKSRLASPIRQCKTISAPKCVCDALVHNRCVVCDKYQHYFNEVTSNMGLGKDEKSTENDYCRISSPSLCQYQYHARQLHDRVTSALSRHKTEAKTFESKSTHDTYKKYDPNEYTIKNYQTEPRPIHFSRYCNPESNIDEYDETYSEYHKSRPLTSQAIEEKRMYSNYIPRTKSEDSRRQYSTKPRNCKEKILKRSNKQKFDRKLDSYRNATFSSVYTSNKPKVRANLEMYKPKHKKHLGARNSNDKNTTSFRSTKVAVKSSIDVFKKTTKKKKKIDFQKISVQSGTKTSTSKSHKTPKYSVVKTVKKCKKNVNKNIPPESNNCVDHLIIIERQSVVKLIEERIKTGEIKFSNKSLNTNSSSSKITPKKDSANKRKKKLRKSSDIKEQINPTYQMKHPFQKIIINTAITKPLRSVEKSVTNIESNGNTCSDRESVESMNQSELEIIEPSIDVVNVSSRVENLIDLKSETRGENIKQELHKNKIECDDLTCPNKLSVDSIIFDDLMDFFRKQKSESSWKSENIDSDEPKSEIEMIKAKMEQLLKTKKHEEISPKSIRKVECNNKTYKNSSHRTPSVESLVDDLMDFFKDQKNIESDEPKSEIEMIKATMEKIVNDKIFVNNQQTKAEKELKCKSEMEVIKSSMGKVVNDSKMIENLMDLIQRKTISEESAITKKESDITKSEFGFTEATMIKAINEALVFGKETKSISTNTDNESSIRNIQKQEEKKELYEYTKSSSVASLIDNISQIAQNLSDEKSKNDLDEYIQNSSIASLVNKISQMTKELEKSYEKSDDNLDEYINNSSIASLVNNISKMVKKLERNNSNNVDKYIKNRPITSMVENIAAQLTEKFDKSDANFSEDIDEFIKASSIASMVENITQTVKELEKIAKEEKENEPSKTDNIVKKIEICKCPPIPILHCTDKVCNQKWNDDTTSSEQIPKNTEIGGINEIWKKIPSKFISSDETCVPKWSSHDSEFIVRPPKHDSKDNLQSSSSFAHGQNNFQLLDSYDYTKKQEKYSCKEIYKNELPISTEKSNDSSKLISSETVWNDEFYNIDQTNSLTIGTNEVWIKSDPRDKNQQETPTLSDRYANKPQLRKKFSYDKSSTIVPETSSDMFTDVKTKYTATDDTKPSSTDNTNKKWNNDTYDGVVTESLTGIPETHNEEWSNDPGKLIISKSLTSGTEEPSDKISNDTNMRTLGIGTDNSTNFMSSTFNDGQTSYSDKTRYEKQHHPKPLKVNVNEALKKRDFNNQYTQVPTNNPIRFVENQPYPKPLNININEGFTNKDSSYKYTDVTTNTPIRIVDDTKPKYIPNEIPIKKLIGALIRTIEYISKRRNSKNDKSQKRICFMDSDMVNDSQGSNKSDSFNRKLTSGSSSDHNCYLNIEQLSNALLKTIEYMSKSNKVYDSADIEIYSDNFSNIAQSDGTPNNIQRLNEASQNGNYIYKNKTPSYTSAKNNFAEAGQDVSSLLTNPEFQIKSNYAKYLLPVLSNQTEFIRFNQPSFDLQANDDVYPTKLQSSSHSEFVCSKTLNSTNDIDQQLLQSENKMNTIIDDEVEKFTQKQYLTTKRLIKKAGQSSESILKPPKLHSSNQSHRKHTHFHSISDHIMPNYSYIEEEHTHHFHGAPMGYFGDHYHCNIEMIHFNDGYRRKFYTYLETFYEKLHRRAHVRAQQERELIDRNCFCN